MGEVSPYGTGGLLGGLTVGSTIAGYRLEEQIGVGGMAVVFRARDERLGRQVALKVLPPALAWDQEFRQRFLRESRAAAAIDDPHIIPVYEAGQAGDLLFIAMRYVPTGDALTLLRRDGPLPLARALGIICAVSFALDAAHAAGLVHRDVKPANMLVEIRAGRPDHAYLSDFGLSKAVISTGLTGTGQILGTPSYMAPEQIQGRAVDGRTDQYALACAAFELLTGHPPFERDQPLAVIYAHLSEPPPSASSRRPDLPSEADKVFSRGLAKTPKERYATCGGFAESLRQALERAPQAGPGVAPRRAQPAQPVPRLHKPDRSASLLKQARDAAEQISYQTDRTKALISIVRAHGRTDRAKVAGLLDEAERLAHALSSSEKHRPLRNLAEAAALTDPDRAERVAGQITEPLEQFGALVGIAKSLTGIDPDRAARVLDEAERLARAQRDQEWHAAGLRDVASVELALDPGRSARLSDEVERFARTITDDAKRGTVLLNLARELAATDPDRAHELIVEAEPLPAAGIYWVTAWVSLAKAEAPRNAERAAEIFSVVEDAVEDWSGYFKNAALHEIATAMAGSAPDQALRIARSVASDNMKVETLTAIAAQLADTDPARAERLLADTERLAQALTDNYWKAQALCGIAEVYTPG